MGAKPVAAASARNAAVDDILIPGAYRPSTDSTGRLELRIVSTYRGPADWHPPSTAEVAPPDREHATFWPTQDRASADGRTLTYAARLGYGWPASETTGPRLAVACTVAPPRRPAGTLVAVAWEPLPWPRTPARPSSAASWTVPVPEGLTQPCIATLHARLGAYPWRWQGGVTWIVEASP